MIMARSKQAKINELKDTATGRLKIMEEQQEVIGELKDEIARLKAELVEARKKSEPTDIGNSLRDIAHESKLEKAEKVSLRAIAKEFDRLTAKLEAKDKLLQKVLSYGEEGLTIDETFANEIEQALQRRN
jgi:uncharacterized small protein (DUF1192 family)